MRTVCAHLEYRSNVGDGVLWGFLHRYRELIGGNVVNDLIRKGHKESRCYRNLSKIDWTVANVAGRYSLIRIISNCAYRKLSFWACAILFALLSSESVPLFSSLSATESPKEGLTYMMRASSLK